MKPADIEKNEWHELEELDEVITTIKFLALGIPSKSWSWVRNMRCKYVDIRIDMRNGGFVIKNREGNRITLEELKRQL